jgi:hypothetical protein
MLMKLTAMLCCALGALMLAARGDAAVLYGSTAAGGPGELYILNAANGAVVQDIGPLNDVTGLNYPITGLAFNPTTGVLYGSTANSQATTRAELVTIDPATARVTVIGAFNVGNTGTTPSTMSDLSFNSAGNLYGIGSVGGPQLYSINPLTGQATVIGSSGLTSTGGGGLAISSAGTYYGTPTATRFGTYDSTTGAYTNIANPAKPVGGAYAALAFGDGGVLYGLDNGAGTPPPSHLVTIDPATGAVTDLGQSVTQLDAIAFRPIPEPAMLSAFAGIALFVRRTRRARA